MLGGTSGNVHCVIYQFSVSVIPSAVVTCKIEMRYFLSSGRLFMSAYTGNVLKWETEGNIHCQQEVPCYGLQLYFFTSRVCHCFD